MLYRALESLKIISTGRRIPAGTIDSLKKVSPETIAMLIAKKRISAVQVPPLAILLGPEKAAEYPEKEVHDFEVVPEEVLREIRAEGPGPEPDPTWPHAERWDAEHVYELDEEGELTSRDPQSEVPEAEDEEGLADIARKEFIEARRADLYQKSGWSDDDDELEE